MAPAAATGPLLKVARAAGRRAVPFGTIPLQSRITNKQVNPSGGIRRFHKSMVPARRQVTLVVRVARCRSKVFGERERAVAEMVNGRLPGGEAGVGVWSRRVTCTAQTSH